MIWIFDCRFQIGDEENECKAPAALAGLLFKQSECYPRLKEIGRSHEDTSGER
jgi:hypothetical protein